MSCGVVGVWLWVIDGVSDVFVSVFFDFGDDDVFGIC